LTTIKDIDGISVQKLEEESFLLLFNFEGLVELVTEVTRFVFSILMISRIGGFECKLVFKAKSLAWGSSD